MTDTNRTPRNPTLTELLRLASPVGLSPDVAQQQARCAFCGEHLPLINPFRDVRSEQEYGISGMCQACQDRAFDTESEDTPLTMADLDVVTRMGAIEHPTNDAEIYARALPIGVQAFLQQAPMMVLCGGALRDMTIDTPGVIPKDYDFVCLDWREWYTLDGNTADEFKTWLEGDACPYRTPISHLGVYTRKSAIACTYQTPAFTAQLLHMDLSTDIANIVDAPSEIDMTASERLLTRVRVLLSGFDFTVCKVALGWHDGKWVLYEESRWIRHCAERRLTYARVEGLGFRGAAASLKRAIRWLGRGHGWKLSEEDLWNLIRARMYEIREVDADERADEFLGENVGGS